MCNKTSLSDGLAREQYELQSGKKVVTSLNAKNLKALKSKDEDGGDEQ